MEEPRHDPPNTALAKKALLGLNFFIETNRMEAFVAVYYIAFKDWNEVDFGIISLVMNVVMIVLQTPAGDFLDKASRKKIITAVAILVASITTAAVAWTSNFWAVMFIKAIEGAASTIFLPALMSLLYGICLTKSEVPSFIARNEVYNKVGSVFFTLSSGLLGYFLYPNVPAIFYLLGAGGLVATLFAMMIPSSAIDDDRARQLVKSKAIDEKEEGEGEGIDVRDVEQSDYEETIVDGIPSPTAAEDNDGFTKENNDQKATPYTYCKLLGDKNILILSVVTFFFHLANAGITPLIAQYIAIGNLRESMAFTSAILLIFYVFQAITAQIMRTAIKKVQMKTLLVYAHIFLLVRCVVIAVMIEWLDNPYALASTQLLEGITGGIFDTVLPIIVGQLTENTGRFGFAYGFIIMCWRCGHGVSLLLGESAVHLTSYAIAFLIYGGIALFSTLLVVFGFKLRSEDDQFKTQKEDTSNGPKLNETFRTLGLDETLHPSTSNVK